MTRFWYKAPWINTTVCKVLLGMEFTLYGVSVFHLVALSLERHVLLCFVDLYVQNIFLFTNLTAAEKLLLTIQWYDSTLMYPKVIIVSFVLPLQVPGHLFANESPCISKLKEIIWDLSWYLGVGSASKHTDWSLQGLYDVLPIVNQVCVQTWTKVLGLFFCSRPNECVTWFGILS